MKDFALPLDYSGKAVSNLVPDEVHVLSNRQVRTLVLDYGGFFTESIKLIDLATNKPLVPVTDYSPGDVYAIPTAESGKQVCAELLITNPAISNNVSVTYQAIGGKWSNSHKVIFEEAANLLLDDRPVAWDEIYGRDWYLTPKPHHLHDSADTYGLEYIVAGLEYINEAIIRGDAASHQQIWADLEVMRSTLEQDIAAAKAKLQAHINDYNNPHHDTAAQLDAYTIPEIDQVMAALTTVIDAMLADADAAVNVHTTNLNNAHNITPAMINAYTAAEFRQKLADTIKKIMSGSDGYWQYVYMAWADSASFVNDQSYAVEYCITVLANGNAVACNVVVGGLVISNAYQFQTVDGDGKAVLAYVKVPAGATLTVTTVGGGGGPSAGGGGGERYDGSNYWRIAGGQLSVYWDGVWVFGNFDDGSTTMIYNPSDGYYYIRGTYRGGSDYGVKRSQTGGDGGSAPQGRIFVNRWLTKVQTA